MKLTIVVLSFLLSVSLIIVLPSGRTTISGAALRERNDSRSASPEEDFPYANRIDPQKYLELYNAIQKMPSEDATEKLKRRGLSSVKTSLTQWESYGPLGVPGQSDPTGNQIFGRIRTMLWYYNIGGGYWERYIGAGSGGLYYGQPVFTSVIWQSLGDNLPNPSVGAIAVDPINPNVILVGTGDWGRDYGAGMFKTTNRGLTWTSVGVYSVWITKVAYLLGNTTMIAAGWNGVYRSTNGGDNWSHISVEPGEPGASCYNLVVVNPARLYAALPKYGVYTSGDGGVSWSKVSNGLPTRCGMTLAIDVSTSNPEILYAAYTDTSNNQGGIYKSTNSGASWSKTNDPPTYIENGQGAHVNVIRIHPSNPNTIYAGSVGFVKSTNGGTTWTTPEAGHSDHTGIEFDPNNENNVYLCSDGGIILRNDAMNTISNANYAFVPGAPLQVYEMDNAWSKSEEMVAGTQDNGEIFTTVGSNPASQWLQIGGCDGGNQLTIDPNNPSIIYGNDWCGSSSPRWRTTDGGATAENIDNGLPNGTYIPIRYSKGGPAVLFTCSLTGLYNSYNRGETWLSSTVNAGNDFPGPYPWLPELRVNNYATLSNKVCYVTWGAHNYVIQGTPGAMTVTGTSYSFNHLIPDRGVPDEVFGLLDGSLYKSTDRGSSWTNISGTYPDYLPGAPLNDVVEITTGGAMYAATTMGVFKTNDGGQHWFRFQDGLPVASVTRIIYIPGVKYDTLRIATYGRGFWQRLIDDVSPNPIASAPFNGIIHGFAGRNDVIFGMGTLGRGLKSTNAGNSWDTIVTVTPNNLNAVGMLGDLTVIAAGDAGTVLRSTDAGTTWNPTAVPTPGNVTGMSITTGGIPWLCTDDGSLLKSTDAGETWFPQITFPGTNLRSCQFVNDLHGALLGRTPVGGGGEVVYFTSNGGDMWMPSYLPTENNMYKLFFTGESEGYAVGDSGVIIKTTDGGTSWMALNSGVSKPLYDCFFTNPLTGYVCGDGGTFLKTEDGGTTWIDASHGLTGDLRAITLSSTNLLIGGDGEIYHTSQVHLNTTFYSLNKSWNLVSLPVSVPDSTVATLFPSRTAGAFTYSDVGGYASSSTMSPGRGCWLKFSSDDVATITGTPAASVSIPVSAGWNLIGSASIYVRTQDIQSMPAGMSTSQFFGYNGTYNVSTTIEPGKAYWVKANQAGTLILTSSSSGLAKVAGRIRIEPTNELPPPPPDANTALNAGVPAAFQLGQNYPNPFNPTTTLRFDLPRDARVTLKVYDILGKEVATLVDGVEKQGFRSVNWNASSISSGIYFYRMEAEAIDHSQRFSESRKMILIK